MDGWTRNGLLLRTGRRNTSIRAVGFITTVWSHREAASGREELSHLSRWGVTEEHTASWLRVVIGSRGLAAPVSEIPLWEYTSVLCYYFGVLLSCGESVTVWVGCSASLRC